ncbi:unnamed protein product [Ambrosiozyma monospora]|uniref:Unnamed protein product n=1 Tax=Ambrosiozyma monospora TaxID=43982 RepID=A0A9W7DIM6_AMBMO|nr:unnamed protein product [Ambrosiozyma monospora]
MKKLQHLQLKSQSMTSALVNALTSYSTSSTPIQGTSRNHPTLSLQHNDQLSHQQQIMKDEAIDAILMKVHVLIQYIMNNYSTIQLICHISRR